jgi:futalosine hydrolase
VTRLLVVTAIGAERDAVLAGLGPLGRSVAWPPRPGPTADVSVLPSGVAESGADIVPVDVVAGGVGPAAAAACAGVLLALAGAAGRPYTALVSAGIAGGFVARASVGETVIGTRGIAADLGADSPDGFLPLSTLGFGVDTVDADPALVDRLRAALPAAVVGPVLTASTVTGTAGNADELLERHPDAVAEAMEGFGVASAAQATGLPFVELRTISNPVGPRDRAAWRIGDALAALTTAGAALGTLVE